MVKIIYNDGTAVLECPECGTDFSVEYNVGDDPLWADTLKQVYDSVYCQKCCDKRKAEIEAEEERKRKEDLADAAEIRMENSGIPLNFRNMSVPYIRHVAEWIYRNRNRNLLIGGETGTGKTSSACFVAKFLIDQGEYVKYFTRRKLTAEYVRSKCDSDINSGEMFLSRLAKNDLIIIDELVGKKGSGKMTPAEQELYFALVDGVYSGEYGCKLWIIGNFYDGAIKSLFDDPEPLKRRLNERFRIAFSHKDKMNEHESVN